MTVLFYEIPCKNCNKAFVGEIGTAFGTRSYMKDAEKVYKTTGDTRGLVEKTRLKKCISQLSQTTLLNSITVKYGHPICPPTTVKSTVNLNFLQFITVKLTVYCNYFYKKLYFVWYSVYV